MAEFKTLFTSIPSYAPPELVQALTARSDLLVSGAIVELANLWGHVMPAGASQAVVSDLVDQRLRQEHNGRYLRSAEPPPAAAAPPEPEPGTVAYAAREFIRRREGIAQRFPINAMQAEHAQRHGSPPPPASPAPAPPPTSAPAPPGWSDLGVIISQRMGRGRLGGTTK
jgi:hypothetical protein